MRIEMADAAEPNGRREQTSDEDMSRERRDRCFVVADPRPQKALHDRQVTAGLSTFDPGTIFRRTVHTEPAENGKHGIAQTAGCTSHLRCRSLGFQANI